uniref:Uncharacterized protein n=1 Tax=Corethron hystrix TaxID=216773 RepID=A0A7S1BF14_9STRA|mmetsp:Transcript_22940/g.52549  ORF Transcript_22940/g.52549 Transcript_22940/m.52549 type:complete len:289 (+) Transcript_22940:59-925(+)
MLSSIRAVEIFGSLLFLCAQIQFQCCNATQTFRYNKLFPSNAGALGCRSSATPSFVTSNYFSVLKSNVPMEKGYGSSPSKHIDMARRPHHFFMTDPMSASSMIQNVPSPIDVSSMSSLLLSDIAGPIFSNSDIKTAFSVATFLPQIFWAFIILTPKAQVTKKVMGGYEAVTLCALVHFFIVAASIAQPEGTAPIGDFADVFDPSGDPQTAMMGMMKNKNFVSEEWSHVLTWDLFVGRWIWLDGLRRGIFTAHSVLLCNLIGPPGLLLHWATCLVTGKGFIGNEVPDDE